MERNLTSPPHDQNDSPDSSLSRDMNDSIGVASDEQLIDQALAGDEVAFTRLFNRYKRKILLICLRYTGGDRSKAFDLCQETFISAFGCLVDLRDKSRFSNWLHEIAKNKCISFARKQKTFNKALRDYEILRPAMSEDKPQWSDAEIQVVEDLIKNLKNRDVQKTVQLFYIEGKETAKIAEIQGISQTAVTSRLNRFRAKFKKRIALAILEKRAADEE